jgi:L-seryl-tRNA(Ser) seleniumtransferase
MQGFTSSVGVEHLATLGPPVVVDIGSGLLARDPLLPDEPDAQSALAAGADLVVASGDKLLGGPQAGLLLGARAVVDRLRRHPVARALRVDKLRLAALEATVRGPLAPTTVFLHADESELRRRADALAAEIASSGVAADVVRAAGVVGGGGAPGLELPGWAVALEPSYAERLRQGTPCVVARVERGRCLLDLRCIPAEADRDLVKAVLGA